MTRTALLLAALALTSACQTARESTSPAPVAALYRIEAFVVEGPASIGAGIALPTSSIVAMSAVEEMRSRAGAETVSRPRMLVRDGSQAEISNTQKISYVQDFQAVNGVADPVVGSIEEGLRILATPRCSGGDTVLLSLDIGASDLVRPISESTVRVPGTDQDVTVQLPEVAYRNIRTRVDLAREQAALFRFDAPARDGAERVRYVVVRCVPEG